MKLEKATETFVGQLQYPPELRYTPSGKAVTTFAVETAAMSIHCQAWETLAENIAECEYAVGEWVTLEGRLKVRTWEDRDGKQHSGECIAVQKMGIR